MPEMPDLGIGEKIEGARKELQDLAEKGQKYPEDFKQYIENKWKNAGKDLPDFRSAITKVDTMNRDFDNKLTGIYEKYTGADVERSEKEKGIKETIKNGNEMLEVLAGYINGGDDVVPGTGRTFNQITDEFSGKVADVQRDPSEKNQERLRIIAKRLEGYYTNIKAKGLKKVASEGASEPEVVSEEESSNNLSNVKSGRQLVENPEPGRLKEKFSVQFKDAEQARATKIQDLVDDPTSTPVATSSKYPGMEFSWDAEKGSYYSNSGQRLDVNQADVISLYAPGGGEKLVRKSEVLLPVLRQLDAWGMNYDPRNKQIVVKNPFFAGAKADVYMKKGDVVMDLSKVKDLNVGIYGDNMVVRADGKVSNYKFDSRDSFLADLGKIEGDELPYTAV